MEKYIFFALGFIIGGLLIYLWQKQKFFKDNAQLIAQLENLESSKELDQLQQRFSDIERKYEAKSEEYNTLVKSNAILKANSRSLQEKLDTQKAEIEAMGKKFNTEFENIANRILKTNTETFSETNKEKLKTLLEPLDQNLKAFKQKVEDVYFKESRERFSLGQKVEDLVKLNHKISQDAINLTKALKGDVKKQGRWGEMILENILEASNLRKGSEYFMEYQLFGPDGKPLRSEVEGKKMRPDVLIKYPDQRNVIIDSKVSLNAFTRYFEATEKEAQDQALSEHVGAIKNHIIALSSKGYDDFDKTLDFVMMFVPSEPAYIAAMKKEPNLWEYAYERRILLMNPTNLITSLKLIVDLWKREYQNENAVAIASRGAKLYDKFVGFVENLEKVGKHMANAQNSFDDAYKQLSTGNDNLVLQATKLKNLGVKNKKNLNDALENDAQSYNLD